MAGHCQPTPPPETPGHSQASLGQCLLGSLLLFPRSWCKQVFVCALQESVPPVLWKFCNQVPLAFKVIFPGGSQSLCWIPRLGIQLVVLQLVGHLPHGSMVGLWWPPPRGLMPHVVPPRSAAARAPSLPQITADLCCWRQHSDLQRQVWLSLLWGPWVLLCARFCLCPPSVSGGKIFNSKHNFAPPTILLGLILCPWTCGIFFRWDPTFSCRWLFSSCSFGVLAGENEHASFYFTIL